MTEGVHERNIGREQLAVDIADPERLSRLSALLDRNWLPGDGMPPLGHFVLFRPDERQSRIGEDGHPLRDPDGMLPAVALPRRMWAGSRIRFHQPIVPGQKLVRESQLTSAVAKSGKSGDMLFCTVAHRVRAADDGAVLISEEQDIVYREAHKGPCLAVRPVVPPEFVPQHTRTRSVSPIELFRYSALTFNSHRIHYDRVYASGDEGYQRLVVHGPYLATMLFDHLVQSAGGRHVAEFSFRAVSPSFDGEDLTFGVTLDGDEALLSITHDTGLAMTGKARLAAD